MILLTDKNQGIEHEHAKEGLIGVLANHIRAGLENHSGKNFDGMSIHILASNFTESLLEIARHYKNETWAKEMLDLVIQFYFKGMKSL